MTDTATFYAAMVEEAAESAAETGILDLVSLAQAGEAGFNTATFTNDVQQLLSQSAA